MACRPSAGGGAVPPPPDIVDSAFLFSVPPLASFATLIFADMMIGGSSLLRRLGLSFTSEGLFAGIAKGLMAAVVIVPPTYAVSILTDMMYRHVQFEHPKEHQLLTFLGETPVHPIARVVLMISATLIAPMRCRRRSFFAVICKH